MSAHYRAGYHPSHKPPSKKDGEKATQKEQGFYHTTAWRRVRQIVLQRDNYLCKLGSSKKCTLIATEVHHIQPLEDFPELALDLDNLISCCWWCHEETKQRASRPLPSGVRIIRVRDGEEKETALE